MAELRPVQPVSCAQAGHVEAGNTCWSHTFHACVSSAPACAALAGCTLAGGCLLIGRGSRTATCPGGSSPGRSGVLTGSQSSCRRFGPCDVDTFGSLREERRLCSRDAALPGTETGKGLYAGAQDPAEGQVSLGGLGPSVCISCRLRGGRCCWARRCERPGSSEPGGINTSAWPWAWLLQASRGWDDPPPLGKQRKGTELFVLFYL